MKSNKKTLVADIVIAGILALCLLFVCYFGAGFPCYGLRTPLAYGGGDDFTQYVTIKTIGEKGWFWHNDDLGAPYSRDAFDFPANFLMNTENLISKIIYCIVGDTFFTMNLQYLLTFALCGFIAFLVLREMKYPRLISLAGATLYGSAPYVFARGLGHYCLSASYFVPCSILLCVWAYQDDSQYMSFKGGFFADKRSVFSIVFALMIANNGIGYYPIFTCFFLLVTAVYKVGTTGNIKSAYKALLTIAMIFVFFVLAISPVLIYWIENGKNPEVGQRAMADAELYGLKIIQLFIPINGHEIPALENFISNYRTSMPLVNENSTAYIGVGGGIGFLISLCWLFVCSTDTKADKRGNQRMQLFCRLNVCAILYASIGGFSAVIFMVFPMLRGFNRISIFIMFISICVLCEVFQRLWEKATTPKKKAVYVVAFTALICLCLFDQLPRFSRYNATLEANQAAYNSDHDFVQMMEEELQEGDMVFQLPYHATPERGPVRQMSDSHLYTGYLHSKTLKWSYGGNAGRSSDLWNRYVSSMPTETMLKTIIANGFRGVYIDARAYETEELNELTDSIQAILSVEEIVSENGNLIFFNLYPYIEEHPDVLKNNRLQVEDIPTDDAGKIMRYPQSLSSEDAIWFCGVDRNADEYVHQGISGNEGDFAWTDGKTMGLSFALSDFSQEKEYVFSLDYCGTYGGQTVIVRAGETVVYEDTLDGEGTISFEIEPDKEGCVQLNFEFPGAVSPKELGVSDDARVLALQLQKATVNEKP